MRRRARVALALTARGNGSTIGLSRGLRLRVSQRRVQRKPGFSQSSEHSSGRGLRTDGGHALYRAHKAAASATKREGDTLVSLRSRVCNWDWLVDG